ncbi:MAG: hypothetical protein Q4C59_01320 [Lachnospiraceae bacterium]|nr:hypothetical protein [Lachnospiraceae bacterium]
MKEKVKEFFLGDWTLTEKILLVADVLLFGVLLGWLTSPFKSGWEFCSNNSWDINTKPEEEEEEE